MKYKKILIINPSYQSAYFTAPVAPVGIGYLAEFLKSGGVDYSIFDMALGYNLRDLKKRIETHNKGREPSTKTLLPFELAYYEACQSKYDALRREKYLKSTYGKRYLKNRLRDHLSAYSTGQGKER